MDDRRFENRDAMRMVNEDGGMEAWRSKMNHRSGRTTRKSTDGMLGCLIFSVTRTNNLIGSFVPPHTPNGHAGLRSTSGGSGPH